MKRLAFGAGDGTKVAHARIITGQGLRKAQITEMKQYLELLDDVLTHGVGREDRTGTGTIGVFGRQSRYDLRDGFRA